MLQTTLLNQCKWRENQINRKQNKNKKPKTIQPPCDMTNNTVHPQWCVWLWFFFLYWILMSSNTPQNLETPILGSKIKRLLSSRQVSASDCGWLTDVSADDATCRGKPALNCIKSQKTQRETEARWSPLRCKKGASTLKTALKKKKKKSYSWQSKQTMSDENYDFSSATVKSRFSPRRTPDYSEEDRHRSNALV